MGEDMSFREISIGEKLREALAKENITSPTPVERIAIPLVFAGEDIIVKAPTGTGKTLAYLLPVMEMLKGDFGEAVILSPTYELAMQIARVSQNLAADGGLPIKTLGLIGGANMARQMEKLKTKPQVIVGTVDRLQELAQRGKLKLGKTRFLVLDEFDRLLDNEHQEAVVDFIKYLKIENVQILAFSATAPKKIRERLGFLREMEFVCVEEEPGESRREDFFLTVPFRKKVSRLISLTRTLPIHRGLVFFDKSFDAKRALEKVTYEKISAALVTGSEDKAELKNALEAFDKGKVTLLLVTDLASRGLDFKDVDTVVNMSPPETPNAYLHRAGRTARAGAGGRVITLMDPKESASRHCVTATRKRSTLDRTRLAL